MTPSTTLADAVLGVSSGVQSLHTTSLIREANHLMANQARRELLLFSRALDPDLYDQRDFIDAVRRLALARPTLPVRILLFEPRSAIQSGHRLIELGRHLTSRIAIRRVSDDFLDRPDAFLIADATGYIRRPLATRVEAIADFHAPRETRQLRADFEQIWEHSDADPELQRLHL